MLGSIHFSKLSANRVNLEKNIDSENLVEVCNCLNVTVLGINVNPRSQFNFDVCTNSTILANANFSQMSFEGTYVHGGEVCKMMGLTFAANRRISNAASRVLLPFMTDGLFVANFMPK